MKKFLAIFCVLLLAVSLAGCGEKEKDPMDGITIPGDIEPGDFLPHSNAATLFSPLEAIGKTAQLKVESMADYYASYAFKNVEIAGIVFETGYLSYMPPFGGVDEINYTATFGHDAEDEFKQVVGYLVGLYELQELREINGAYQGKHVAENETVYLVYMTKLLNSETDCAINIYLTAEDRPSYVSVFEWAELEEPLNISALAFDFHNVDELVNEGMSYEEVRELFGADGNEIYSDSAFLLCAFIGPYSELSGYNSVALCAFQNDRLELATGLAYDTETLIYTSLGEGADAPWQEQGGDESGEEQPETDEPGAETPDAGEDE